ncbi:NAD(P)H-dependent oxidoreductase subunit E [Pacificimonas sp. WHA3]|uniref:NAD(P)H-dependent oxidoreductase subunit E n=1 Tax=Pacificimonas pallii TaxID=2827236 RepID=A0ABS6SE23_9SPHN|nr:NADH-quinone oxidoreductase subunit NuoE [Pacificimonas pallii]MBV7256673.1 NAD(P)H-dependent oxidoreductase subunit E [Pacificimonas pallii]
MTAATYSSVDHAKAEAPARPDHHAFDGFAWTQENAKLAAKHIAKYPEGRQASAVMPLLDLAQRQVGAQTGTQGWLPIPVIEFVAKELAMPYMRVYEVVTFYTMYNLNPVGKFHVQLCGTTPCMLRGSDDVMKMLNDKGIRKGMTTPDGMFTLTEVECMGNCATAPMLQINDDNYECLDADSTAKIIDALAAGEQPTPGPQDGRHSSEPAGGLTSLKEFAA